MAVEGKIGIFLSGAFMMGLLVCSLFFCRSWMKTRDRLFAMFSLSFFLMAMERIILLSYPPGDEARSYVHLLRLSASLLILYTIVDKNRFFQPRKSISRVSRKEIA